MALNICYESMIRTILVIIKLAYQNWFYTLGFIVLAALSHKHRWIQGGLGALANFLADAFSLVQFVSIANIFAFIFTFAVGAALKVFLSSLVGIAWVLIVLMGNANIFLKMGATPVFFFLGLVWGLLPIPIPLSFVLPYLFGQRRTANIVCIVCIGIFFLIGLSGAAINIFGWQIFAGQDICTYLNGAVRGLQ